MNWIFPTPLHLSVIRSSARMSLHSEDGTKKSSESFVLVLRASRETNIVLSTGERLADVEINFTLSTKWQTSQELDQDLTDDDVGFLVHTEGEKAEPFVHGAALLPSTTVIAALLSGRIEGTVTLDLPSVLMNERTHEPFVWGRNRPQMLRIRRLDLSVGHALEGHNEG